MALKNDYWVESIKTLTQREAVRKKFWMYIGDNGIRGFHHLLYEVISNSTDEMINGYGDRILVRLHEKNIIEVQDFWRWIPFWKNKNGEEVLEMIFTTLHSWWKMDNTKEGSWYKVSGWTNGVWTSVLNFLSTLLKITVKKEWKVAELVFENWVSQGLKIIWKCDKNESWTSILFSPDLQIFPQMKWFDEDYIKRMLNDQSILQRSNLVFENLLTNETITYRNDDGIKKYVLDKNKEITEKENEDWSVSESKKTITQQTEIIFGDWIEMTWPEWQFVSLDYAFEAIAEDKGNIRGYTNSIHNPDGWEHIKWFKAWIYKGICNLIDRTQSKTLLKDLEQDDLIDSIVWIINIKISDPDFEWQTKWKLTNLYVKKLITEIISREVERKISDKDLWSIIKQLQTRIDTRKKIEQIQMNALEKITNESALLKKLWTKLRDAQTKNRKDAELYIIEWDSAWGSLVKERNPEIHAIMPLKGKGLNVLKDWNQKKLFSNAEVNNIMYAISWGFIWHEFDINKHLRYGKIVILADADVDWLHISMLVLSTLLKFYPNLIEKWHVYIGVSPLFVCKYKEDYKYFYTDQEKNKFISTTEGKKHTTARFKWLWEMDSEDLYKVAFWRSRTLVKVTMEDANNAKDFFNMIMWDEPRKKFEFVQSYIEAFVERLDKNEVFDVRVKKDIVEIAKDNMTMYSIEVNEERAVPALEDWLKNVHRRILYWITERLWSKSNWAFIKSAKVVWEVMWSFHPHGDKSIFDAMVWITQDFSNNFPLIQGKWAFGSIFNKWWVAAPRYNEVKIAEISEDLLLDNINKNSVNFINNYDDTLKEPIILPAKLPFSLLIDSFGIGAAGTSSWTVAHNIREVIQAVKAYIETKWKNFNATDYIKWPDVSSGWILINTSNEIKSIYENQFGWTFIFRVPINVEKDGKNNVLVIKEVPYYKYNAEWIEEKINTLIEKKDILGVKSLNDKSWKNKNDKKELKIVIQIQQDIDINLIIEDLYKKTDLQIPIRYNPVYVNRHRQLRRYTLNEIVSEFVQFRKETLTNIFNFEAEKVRKEISNLEAKKIFSINIDKVVKIIKEWNKRDDIKKEICKEFKIDDEAAEIIITTQLISIKDLKAIENKIKEAEKELKRLEKLLSDEKTFSKYMIDEYESLLEKYKNVRRKTKLLTNKEVLETRDMSLLLEKKRKEEKNKIEDKQVWIVVTKSDFIMKIVWKEDTITNKINDLGAKEIIKHAHICSNTWTLYLINNDSKWYFQHIHKMKDKEDTAVNRLVKWFNGEIIGSFVYWEWFQDGEIMIIYDDKGKIWWYRILKSDLIKSKQWYALWKNKILFVGETDKVLLSKIISLSKYSYKKDIEILSKKLPLKKSPSSWVKI